MWPEQLVERFEHLADSQVLDLLHRSGEVAPEVAQHVLPLELVVGDEIELLLEVGGEVVFDVAFEEALEEGDDQPPFVLGDQALFLDAHIVAILQDRQCRGIGRGSADAELLHVLDERGFRIARRGLGEVLLGLDALVLEMIALRQRRQPAALLVFLVAAFLVEPEETVEHHDRAGGSEAVGLAVAALHVDVRRRLLELGRCHLARHRPLPHELVEPRLVALQALGHLVGRARHVRRPDRLVRLLGVLGLGLVLADEGRHVALAEVPLQLAPDLGDGLGRDLHAVGSHIGNEADRLAADVDAFVQALGHLHGLARREAELARGLLLQRRGGERCVRIAPHRLLLHRRDAEVALLDSRLDGVGRGRRP